MSVAAPVGRSADPCSNRSWTSSHARASIQLADCGTSKYRKERSQLRPGFGNLSVAASSAARFTTYLYDLG
jgi:hypothetical protein